MTEQRLPGGRTFGAVRIGDQVRRPAQPWSASVQSVLRHLEQVGFAGAPRPRGFDDDGREALTFLPGTVRTRLQPRSLRLFRNDLATPASEHGDADIRDDLDPGRLCS